MSRRLSESEFEDTVREALPGLLRTAQRLTGDPELAEDAVQTALLKATRSWKKFRGDAELITWITRILINCIRDAIAKKRRQIEHATADQDVVSSVASAREPHPSGKLLEDELKDKIQAAMIRLPDRQREVFALVTWQGMTAEEVGDLLGIGRQSVYANLHAAKKRLRELLASYAFDTPTEPRRST